MVGPELEATHRGMNIKHYIHIVTVRSMEEAANAVCKHISGGFGPPSGYLGTMIPYLSKYYQHSGSIFAQSNPHCLGLQTKLMTAVATDYILAHWRNRRKFSKM
jgi:hypothetical protein